MKNSLCNSTFKVPRENKDHKENSIMINLSMNLDSLTNLTVLREDWHQDSKYMDVSLFMT